jgi:hypothetical protein
VTTRNTRRTALRREVSRRFRNLYAGMVAQLTPGSLSIWERVQERLAGQRDKQEGAAVPPAVMRTAMQQQPVLQQQQKAQEEPKRDPKPES